MKIKQLFSFVLLLSFILFINNGALCFPDDTPKIPENFNANVYSEYRTGLGVMDEATGPGQYYYDTTDQSLLLNVKSVTHFNFSLLAIKKESFNFINEVCTPQGTSNGGFFDMFSWLKYTKPNGTVTVNGKKCDVYTLTYSGGNITAAINGDTPCYWAVPFEYQGKEWVWNLTFLSFTPGKQNSSVFDVPKNCFGRGLICPNGKVQSMITFRFHPPGDTTLANRNTANNLGDTAYVCYAGTVGQDQLVTKFTVQVNSSWGQYAFCNQNQCVGLNNQSVGREASFGALPYGGQCTNNENYGSWFSFWANSECPSNKAIGTNGCTWKVTNIGKTINADCLTKLGFFKACEKDGGFPYSTALKIFEDAFKYNSTNKGGCAAVNPYAHHDNYIDDEVKEQEQANAIRKKLFFDTFATNSMMKFDSIKHIAKQFISIFFKH